MSSSTNSNLPAQTVIAPPNSTERLANFSITGMTKSQKANQDAVSSSGRGRSGRNSKQNRARGRYDRGVVKFADQTQLPNLPSTSESSPPHQDVNNPNSGPKQPKISAGGGKYKQRHKTHKLPGGISNMAGLEIDLTENVTETGLTRGGGDPSFSRNTADSRKMNLSHFINRKLGKPNPDLRNHNSMLRGRRNHTLHFKDSGTAHKFSKQQFLQANCKFVVLDGYDYSIHRADPDWPVDWECIEEIKFKQCASTETTCPICLESPIAAKITKCGHIYCWTCMLHYLSLSDDKCRQCPICFEFVYKNDLRSVVSHSFLNYSVESEISMRLMFRKKGCIIAEPFKKKDQEVSDLELNDSDTSKFKYWSQDNLLILDAETVIVNIVQRERNELLLKLNEDRDEPEVCFIEQALEMLEERVQRLIGKSSGSLSASRQDHNMQLNSDLSDSYLFYQCSDGQHIYLNPFSTKILCHEYRNLENCRQEFQAKVIQMDWLSMTEAWRKRFRYLGHLPLTCEFRLVEIDFENSNLVSRETFKVFEEQIRNREKERERQRKEERKRDKIIQVEQDRKIYGIQPSLKININNPDQFPSVSDERFIGLSLATDHSVNDGFFSSSDDESAPIGHQEIPVPESAQIQPSRQPDPIADVTISFKDIQLQEEAKQTKTNQVTALSRGPSPPQSSFAQLLVNAKASKKEWTVKTKALDQCSEPRPGTSSIDQHRLEDSGEEEFRAPVGLTISDFIDMNIVSKRKRKAKNG